MKLAGPGFLAPVRRPLRQHPPGAAAGVPRHARPARRPGVRREGHRRARCSSSTPGSTPGRSWRRRRSRSSTTTTRPRCTSGSRRPSARCSSTPSAGWPARAGPSTAGRSRSREQTSRSERRPVRRALVSVYDKTGLDELARGLHGAGVELVSTGSTAATIAALGIPVTQVADLTGFPECLDGRVKTLHPRGARRHPGRPAQADDHVAQLAELGIEPFELVVGQPLPVRGDRGVRAPAPDECVEQIDIGGPTMVRAAAKNHPSVAVVVSPAAYADVLAAVARRRLHARAAPRGSRPRRSRTPRRTTSPSRPGWAACSRPTRSGATASRRGSAPSWDRRAVLRYGENPHQQAALYADAARRARAGPGRAAARQGDVVQQLRRRRRGAPGGVRLRPSRRSRSSSTRTRAASRSGVDIADALPQGARLRPGLGVRRRRRDQPAGHAWRWPRRSATCSPRSSWRRRSTTDALEVLTQRKNVRLLRCDGRHPGRARGVARRSAAACSCRSTDVVDDDGDEPESWTLASRAARPTTRRCPTSRSRGGPAASVKSNAIVLAGDGATVGVGMGQVNRVDSARLAVERAGDERARGSVAASDAFFPFPDGLEVLLDGRRAGRRAARRVGARRRGRRGRRGRRRDDVLHRRPPLLPLSRGSGQPPVHVAQLNVARLLAPIDSPRLAGFVAALDEVNAAADGAPGFVWRLQDESRQRHRTSGRGATTSSST